MSQLLLRVFRFPGETVYSLLDVTDEEDRMMMRTLIDMLVWNVVVVVAAFLLFA